MFEIGWSEILVIAVVALIAIGPKELPGVLRMVGQWMGKIRRMASEFQGQFHEAMREAEMADIKKQVDEIATAAHSITNYDPMESLKHDTTTAHDDAKPAEAPSDQHELKFDEPKIEEPKIEGPKIEESKPEPTIAAPIADVETVHPPAGDVTVATPGDPAPLKAAGDRS